MTNRNKVYINPMKNIQIKYINKILKDLLLLQKGEDLTINTEIESQYFAIMVSEAALKITQRPVNLVITENGKFLSTAPYDPQDCLPTSTGTVLLRLELCSNVSNEVGFTVAEKLDEIIFEDLKNKTPKMGKYNHLSNPVILDRFISIPWCKIPVFKATDTALWKELDEKFLKGIPDVENTELYYTKKRITLNSFKIKKLKLFKEDSLLEIQLQDNSKWINCFNVLTNDRCFFSEIKTNKYIHNLNWKSVKGSFKANYYLLGNKMQDTFEFENGKLLTHKLSKPLVNFFELEENLSKLGFITFLENSITLTFGNSNLDSLTFQPIEYEDIPNNCNLAFYKLEVFPSFDKIIATSEDGKESTLYMNNTLLI